MRYVSASDLSKLNPNFAVMLDSERISPRAGISQWRSRLAKECTECGTYVFITRRKAIENYFSQRALRQYYNDPAIPLLGEYVELSEHIAESVKGRGYNKMRDAEKIARAMTAREVENSDDLAEALRRIQSLITHWKGLD